MCCGTPRLGEDEPVMLPAFLMVMLPTFPPVLPAFPPLLCHRCHPQPAEPQPPPSPSASRGATALICRFLALIRGFFRDGSFC